MRPCWDNHCAPFLSFQVKSNIWQFVRKKRSHRMKRTVRLVQNLEFLSLKKWVECHQVSSCGASCNTWPLLSIKCNDYTLSIYVGRTNVKMVRWAILVPPPSGEDRGGWCNAYLWIGGPIKGKAGWSIKGHWGLIIFKVSFVKNDISEVFNIIKGKCFRETLDLRGWNFMIFGEFCGQCLEYPPWEWVVVVGGGYFIWVVEVVRQGCHIWCVCGWWLEQRINHYSK